MSKVALAFFFGVALNPLVAQTPPACATQLIPFKPLSLYCSNAAPVCVAGQNGMNGRWVWGCPTGTAPFPAQDPGQAFMDAYRQAQEQALRNRQLQQQAEFERRRLEIESQRLDLLRQGASSTASTTPVTPGTSTGPGLAVIAPSISTAELARDIVGKLGVSEVRLRQATVILVVVRSSLYNPLSSSYESVSDLKKDADAQLNISGPTFHVYEYSMDDDLRVVQTGHYQAQAD
ncbi:MAG: hypothetical protein LAO55_18770 [Acidobacteriia bacterium]|nr:hypothetical protein [Terriglobia bacterium]